MSSELLCSPPSQAAPIKHSPETQDTESGESGLRSGQCQLSVIRASHMETAVLQSGPFEKWRVKDAAGLCRSRFSELMSREKKSFLNTYIYIAS